MGSLGLPTITQPCTSDKIDALSLFSSELYYSGLGTRNGGLHPCIRAERDLFLSQLSIYSIS